MSKKETVHPPKLGADAVPTITRRGDNEDEGGFTTNRMTVDQAATAATIAAAFPAPPAPRDTTAFRLNRERGKRLRTALDELQVVAFLPTKDDAHAKSNANKIRSAIAKLHEALELPPE